MISISILITLATPALSSDWTIDDDKVYIDDNFVYLSAEPHTISSSGWVTFELLSKQYSGNIDCIFGFNQPSTKPTKLQIYSNYTHQKETLIPKVTFYNTSFYDVNKSVWVNETKEYTTYVKQYTNETYWDWQPIQGNFNKITHEFQDMNTWYLKQNIPINSGVTYKIRAWLDIDFKGLKESTGKYWWAVKPSGETLNQAISNGHFYYLDPWWNTSWGCRVPIIIDHNYVSEWLHDYPALIVINSTISADCDAGASIRFTLDDNSTLLNFEIEDYDNFNPAGSNYIWVNVTDISPTTNTLIWMYYNNGLATDGQNVPGTWDGHFQGVWHFNESSYLWESTSNGNHGTATNTPDDATGIANGAINFDKASSEYYNMGNVCDQTTNLFTAEGWFNASREYTDEQTLVNKKWSGTNKWYVQIDDSGAGNNYRFACIDAEDDVVTADPTLLAVDGLYHYFVAERNADQYFSLAIMDVGNKIFKGNTIKTGDIGTLTNTEDLCFASYTGGGDYYANCLDEFRISNIARNDSYVNLTFDIIHNNSDVISFGTINCSYKPSYVYYLPDINWLHPANLSNNICPCNGSICFNISNPGGNNMNVTIYYTTAGYAGFYYRVNILEFQNISNGTYCICIDNLYPSAHAVGWSEDNVTATSTNEWHNFTFDNFEAVNIDGTGSAVIIPYTGHYDLSYWLVSKNDEAAPAGDVIALRMINNGHEINASYRQINFQKQDNEQYITSICHDDFDAGDIINFQYIVNDLSCQIVMDGDYTTNDTNAFASIEFIGESLGIIYNQNYYWYINVTNYNDAGGNESIPRVFTTSTNITNCTAAASGEDPISYAWVVGIAVLFGGLIFIFNKRRK